MYDTVPVYCMAYYIDLNSPGWDEGFIAQCLCTLTDTSAGPARVSVCSVWWSQREGSLIAI